MALLREQFINFFPELMGDNDNKNKNNSPL